MSQNNIPSSATLRTHIEQLKSMGENHVVLDSGKTDSLPRQTTKSGFGRFCNWLKSFTTKAQVDNRFTISWYANIIKNTMDKTGSSTELFWKSLREKYDGQNLSAKTIARVLEEVADSYDKGFDSSVFNNNEGLEGHLSTLVTAEVNQLEGSPDDKANMQHFLTNATKELVDKTIYAAKTDTYETLDDAKELIEKTLKRVVNKHIKGLPDEVPRSPVKVIQY